MVLLSAGNFKRHDINHKLTNTTLNENNNFDIWCNEIKLYLENWKGFEYFNNKLYTSKYSDNLYNYFIFK